MGEIPRTAKQDWQDVRLNVLHRDGLSCQNCGQNGSSGVTLHVHHIVPVKNGGRDDEENLVTLCKRCHNNIHSFDRDKYPINLLNGDIPNSETPDHLTSYEPNENAQTIEQILLNEEKSKSEIVSETGFGNSTVSKYLKRLMISGRVERSGYKTYTCTGLQNKEYERQVDPRENND